MSFQKKVLMLSVKLNSYSFWVLFSVVFFVSMAFLLPIRFEENDDVVMLLFASGQYTGTPEFRLVFINSIWGLMLKILYSLTNTIEWYSLLFAICHVFSLSIILWSVFKKRVNYLIKMLFAGIFLLLEIRFIAQFQFTTTTAMLALSGLALTLENDRRLLNIGLIIFAISTLIRFEAAILILILFSPLLIKRFFDNNDWKLVTKFGITFLLITVFFSINHFSYRMNSDWNSYQKYNKIRGAVNDNPNASKISEDSYNAFNVDDYALLLSFFQDYKVINVESIEEVKSSISAVSLKSKLRNVYPALRKHTQIIAIVIVLAVLLSFGNSKSNIYYLIASLLIFLIVCSYVSLNGSLKLRVLLSCIIVQIYSFLHLNNVSRITVFNASAVFVLLYFSFIITNRTKNIISKNERWRTTEFQEQIALFNLYAENNNDFVLPFAGSLSLEYYPVFQVTTSIPAKSLSFGGWVTGIPYNKEKIFTHIDLIDKNVILIHKDSYEYLSGKLIKTIQHNYNKVVYTKTVAQTENYLLFEMKQK